jgi:hypothetical protein
MKKILTSLFFYAYSVFIYSREPSGRGYDWSGRGSEFDGLGILITISIIVLFYGVGGIIALIYDFFQNIKLKRKKEEEHQKLLQKNKEEEIKREIAIRQQKEKEIIDKYIVGPVFSLEAFLNSIKKSNEFRNASILEYLDELKKNNSEIAKSIERVKIYDIGENNNVEIFGINERFRYVKIKSSSSITGLYYAEHMDPYIDYFFDDNISKLKVVRLTSGAYLVFLNENSLTLSDVQHKKRDYYF